MKPLRLNSLPEGMRQELKAERIRRGWSQLELGKRSGLPQMHISGIETGKIVPRFDTLLDLVRVLGSDLVLAPRSLVPAVEALIRDYRRRNDGLESPERPLYADDDSEEREDGDGHES